MPLASALWHHRLRKDYIICIITLSEHGIFAGILIFIFTSSGLFAADNNSNGVPGDLTNLTSLVNQILADVTPQPTPPPTPINQTRLLFPFATNTNGFDTGFAISNTGHDSTGTVGKDGGIKIYFFGGGAPTTNPVVVNNVPAGTTYTNLVSILAPGFIGYIEVDCDFPFGHGFGFFSDVGARNLAATIPVLVLPPQRTNTTIEGSGQ